MLQCASSKNGLPAQRTYQHTFLRHGYRRPCLPPRVAAGLSGGVVTLSPYSLIFEVDGALLDLHQDGHRAAFNNAFTELGFDCANWSPMVYHDLLSCSDGTGEGLVRSYFNTVGWPTMLPTSDQEAFARNVYNTKKKQFQKLVAADKIPLREGVQQVIADALSAGARVALLAGTGSELGPAVADSAKRLLGPDLTQRVQIFHFSLQGAGQEGLEKGQSSDQSISGSSSSSSIDTFSASLAAAQRAVKQRAAQEFVSALQGTRKSVEFTVEANLLVAGQRESVSAEFLAAILATLDASAKQSMVLASSSSVLGAAVTAGMVAVAVPRRCAMNGTYPGALAKFEGYGVGMATWGRLQALLLKQQGVNLPA